MKGNGSHYVAIPIDDTFNNFLTNKKLIIKSHIEHAFKGNYKWSVIPSLSNNVFQSRINNRNKKTNNNNKEIS